MLVILVGVLLVFFGFFCLPIFYGLFLTLLSSLGVDFLGNDDSLNTLSFTSLGLNPFITVFRNEQFFSSLRLTVFTGVTATILSLGMVFFIAGGWFHAVSYRSKKLLPILLAFPHTSFAIGLVFLISPSGLFIRLLAHPLGIAIPPDWSTYQDPYGISLVVGLVFKPCGWISV